MLNDGECEEGPSILPSIPPSPVFPVTTGEPTAPHWELIIAEVRKKIEERERCTVRVAELDIEIHEMMRQKSQYLWPTSGKN